MLSSKSWTYGTAVPAVRVDVASQTQLACACECSQKLQGHTETYELSSRAVWLAGLTENSNHKSLANAIISLWQL